MGSDDAPVPRLPADLVAGAERTWVVFTTPYCAACEPLVQRLRDRGRVVTVDATERPTLARAMRVRSAPTAFLADSDGNALTRLVGADLTRVPST